MGPKAAANRHQWLTSPSFCEKVRALRSPQIRVFSFSISVALIAHGVSIIAAVANSNTVEEVFFVVHNFYFFISIAATCIAGNGTR